MKLMEEEGQWWVNTWAASQNNKNQDKRTK